MKHALFAFASIAALGIGSSPARAGGPSFNDWLARQSTRCKDLDGDGTCCEPIEDQYIQADRSYINFSSPAQSRSAIVDFLGVSSSYLKTVCGVDLGTTVTGSLSVRPAGEGRVLVSVNVHAKNALSYVVDGFADAGDPLYGARQADVCDGADASLADAEFKIDYYADASGAIADNQWFGNPPPALECETADDPFDFRSISLRAHGKGWMADGSPASLVVSQTGIFQPHSHSKNYDGFPVEFIDLHPLGK